MSKFKVGDYVEVIETYLEDENAGIEVGARGYILDEDIYPLVNFVDDCTDIEICDNRSNDNNLYCYCMNEKRLKLVKEANKMSDFKFKIGDYVEVITVDENDIRDGLKIGMRGYVLENASVPYVNFIDDNLNLEECLNKKDLYSYPTDEDQLKLADKEVMKLKIKYFEGATKLKKISKGNWIDCYARKTIFIPKGQKAMIPLGFALELPKGWEGHLAPRSSTFKTWGIIQTNSVGVVDDTYIGDNDEWCMPVYCLEGKHYAYNTYGEGTWINQGDKIAQFRIMEVMPDIEFEEVETLNNEDRHGFGSTGER